MVGGLLVVAVLIGDSLHLAGKHPRGGSARLRRGAEE